MTAAGIMEGSFLLPMRGCRRRPPGLSRNRLAYFDARPQSGEVEYLLHSIGGSGAPVAR
jgi:hypothetical protein